MPDPTPRPTPTIEALTERVEGIRDAARTHEEHDQDRHAEVMGAIREVRAGGEARGDRVYELLAEQQRLVVRAAGLIVVLLIVGLFGVLGVGLGVEVPGVGSVGIGEARAAAPAAPAVPDWNNLEQSGTPEHPEQAPKE